MTSVNRPGQHHAGACYRIGSWYDAWCSTRQTRTSSIIQYYDAFTVSCSGEDAQKQLLFVPFNEVKVASVHHARLNAGFAFLHNLHDLVEELPADLFTASVFCTVENENLLSGILVLGEVLGTWIEGVLQGSIAVVCMCGRTRR